MEGQLNSWLLQRNTHLLTPGTFLQHHTGLHFFLFPAHSLLHLCCFVILRSSNLWTLDVVAFHIIFFFQCLALSLLHYQFILFSLFFDFKIKIMPVFYHLIFYISFVILSFVMYLFFLPFQIPSMLFRYFCIFFLSFHSYK